MSPEQENQVGAEEHEKILAQFGLYENRAVQDYVSAVGAKVVADTERPDVQYKFFVLDSPVVNAFALPGGYIYISRGLLALANSEAELASVLGHEAGHITGRHSADRYSRGVVTSLGTSILSAAIGQTGVSQALGIGSDLYLKSYSRSQENEADTLGIRYMARAGYDPKASTSFLTSLQRYSVLENRLQGREDEGVSYFSTHPATDERVNKTRAETAAVSGGTLNREGYLQKIDGIVYGDSARQGFTRESENGSDFYHPGLGFTFHVPRGYQIANGPSEVVAVAKDGPIIIFDMAANPQGSDPFTYLTQGWMSGDVKLTEPERITVNGMNAAAAAFNGQVNGKPMTIRLVAIAYAPDRFARFQIAIPPGTGAGQMDDLKRTTYSFRGLSAVEKQQIRPYRIDIVTAGVNDTMAEMARQMPFADYREERFALLNDLLPGAQLQAGQRYKMVVK